MSKMPGMVGRAPSCMKLGGARGSGGERMRTMYTWVGAYDGVATGHSAVRIMSPRILYLHVCSVV